MSIMFNQINVCMCVYIYIREREREEKYMMTSYFWEQYNLKRSNSIYAMQW